jgi:NAD(P)-dependent dehydrogenase (short-subunit alcohol dehydrogenase family)
LRRTLVVGASSGIGFALAQQSLARGDAVVLAARRAVTPGMKNARGLSLQCDISDPDACRTLIEQAATFLKPHGGLTTVLLAAGSAPLASVATTTATQWQDLLATNLVGAALIVAEALPHLRRNRDQAAVVVLSSHSVGDPWPGLVPYATSKAALNELAVGLRVEEPLVRTIRISVGPTATSFADGWDAEDAARYFAQWHDMGHLRHQVLTADDTAARILAVLDDPDGPDDVTVIGDA